MTLYSELFTNRVSHGGVFDCEEAMELIIAH